ncbi:MAG: hypothetical protein WC300_04770 [Candidatus Omnitrophota bacterium]|jgi:hypothetical protein
MKNTMGKNKALNGKNPKKKYQKPEIEVITRPEPGTIADAAGCIWSPAICPAGGFVCN